MNIPTTANFDMPAQVTLHIETLVCVTMAVPIVAWPYHGKLVLPYIWWNDMRLHKMGS